MPEPFFRMEPAPLLFDKTPSRVAIVPAAVALTVNVRVTAEPVLSRSIPFRNWSWVLAGRVVQ